MDLLLRLVSVVTTKGTSVVVEEKVSRTFHAFGQDSRTSSRQKQACECKPCDRYKEDSSAQASASVGEASSSSTNARMASEGLARLCSSEIRRFMMG